MRTTSTRLAALGVLFAAAFTTATPSEAARWRTPTAEQSRFFEELRAGKRASIRKAPSATVKRALDAAPAAATATAGAAPMAVRAAAPSSTAVYVSAHPDDFVLFMNPYRDVVQSDTRAVFIFLTAGDAGAGKGPRSAPYYLARENGAWRAVRFMADAATSTTTNPNSDWVRVNGHYVYRTTYKNTATWFLRLPDGAGEGSGYPVHDWASLAKLRDGEIRTIRAVDGSATYNGWNDLVKTMTDIVRVSASGSPNVWFDTHEIDPVVNPGDHSDHLATGQAVAAVQASLNCTNLAYHVGYSLSGLVNLDVDDIENRAAAFGNYSSGLAEKGYPGTSWEPGHKSWLAGMVYRLVNGNGQSCGF